MFVLFYSFSFPPLSLCFLWIFYFLFLNAMFYDVCDVHVVYNIMFYDVHIVCMWCSMIFLWCSHNIQCCSILWCLHSIHVMFYYVFCDVLWCSRSIQNLRRLLNTCDVLWCILECSVTHLVMFRQYTSDVVRNWTDKKTKYQATTFE